jgi:hypothetical protein
VVTVVRKGAIDHSARVNCKKGVSCSATRATGARAPVGLALRGGGRERLGGRCTLKDRMDECNYVPSRLSLNQMFE